MGRAFVLAGWREGLVGREATGEDSQGSLLRAIV